MSFIYDDVEELISNTYLIIDESNNAIAIDPSKDNDKLLCYIKDNHLNLKAIILTHGHADHMGGVNRLIDEFNVDVYIHPDDYLMLDDTYMNCSAFVNKPIIVNRNVKFINEGEFDLLSEKITIIHTSFHTKGSICLYSSAIKALISGDSLFKQGFGRMDLPNACRSAFYPSIKKLFALPDDTKIYPGHGQCSYIGVEKRENYL